MNLKKTTGLVAAALGLVALMSAEAAAQAPTLTVTANGSRVTIEWTAVPGATGYALQAGTTAGAANIASVNLPAFVTRVVVAAPNGTYFLRVRAFAGSQVGPNSNEVSVTIGGGAGPGPCTQPSAPTLSAQVQGGTVTLNWNAVAGAQRYSVEFSRFSGGTELVEPISASATSYQRYVGMVGTFYARLVVATACGTATSSEVSFTIVDLSSGGGPRTPDPPAGQLLPLPSYGAAVVQQIASQYRGELLNSCRETGGNNNYVFRVVQALRQRDSRWGLNYKRGQRGDMSQDIVTYNPTNRPDEGEPQVYLVDIISSHCGSPDWNWTNVTDVTWAARGNPACGTEYCAMWTLEPYRRAGFSDGR